jgi:hypothetical protein
MKLLLTTVLVAFIAQSFGMKGASDAKSQQISDIEDNISELSATSRPPSPSHAHGGNHIETMSVRDWPDASSDPESPPSLPSFDTRTKTALSEGLPNPRGTLKRMKSKAKANWNRLCEGTSECVRKVKGKSRKGGSDTHKAKDEEDYGADLNRLFDENAPIEFYYPAKRRMKVMRKQACSAIRGCYERKVQPHVVSAKEAWRDKYEPRLAEGVDRCLNAACRAAVRMAPKKAIKPKVRTYDDA